MIPLDRLSPAERATVELLNVAGCEPEFDTHWRIRAICPACFDGDPAAVSIDVKHLYVHEDTGVLTCHAPMACDPAAIAHSLWAFNQSPLGSTKGSYEVVPETTDGDRGPGGLELPIGERPEREQLPIGDYGTLHDKVSQALPLLGVAFEEGPCVVPGHDGCVGRVALTGSRYWRYSCTGPAGHSTYTLAEVLASLRFGCEKRFGPASSDGSGSSQWLWHMRMWFDAGLLALRRRTVLTPVPPTVRKTLLVAHAGISLLFDLKRSREGFEDDPVVCSADFLAAWTHGLRGGPITKDEARDAITELLNEGVIVSPGKHRRSRLFLPGAVDVVAGDTPAEVLGQADSALELYGSVDGLLDAWVLAHPPINGKSGLSVTA